MRLERWDAEREGPFDVALPPRAGRRGPVFGEIEPIAVGDLAATSLRTVAQRVVRGRPEIAASPAGLFFLNLQLRGASSFRQ